MWHASSEGDDIDTVRVVQRYVTLGETLLIL